VPVRVRVHVHVRVHVCVYKCRNADCPASNQPGTSIKKTNDAGNGPVPDQTKAVHVFLVPYKTEIINAGMPGSAQQTYGSILLQRV
jgi:hypothetical protein